MHVVEFLGVSGSGKSTLAAELTHHVAGAVSLDEAVRAGIAEHGDDPVTRVAARLGRSGKGRAWDAAYARSTDRFAALARFIGENPRALEAVASIQASRAERDLEADLVLGWILNLMARYQIAGESGVSGALIVDEGFAQRGVALLAGGFVNEDFDQVAGYVEATPRPHSLIVVETPLETCAQRLDRRGWSQRLAGAGAGDRRRFLESSAALVTRIAAEEETRGSRLIWVDGTTSTPDSVSSIAATLAT